MNHENMQAGDRAVIWPFWLVTAPYFKQLRAGGICCDFGSGVTLGFERYIQECNAEVIFDCVDLHTPDENERPTNVRRFIQASVEEKIPLDTMYDIVTSFECIEHIDCTDMLLENCYSCLKEDGYFMISWPNLASIYARIELLLGFQPHALEVCNAEGAANMGMGIFGKANNPHGKPLHHIRGITYKAMKELLQRQGFEIVETKGFINGMGILKHLFSLFPGLCSDILIIARKAKR